MMLLVFVAGVVVGIVLTFLFLSMVPDHPEYAAYKQWKEREKYE